MNRIASLEQRLVFDQLQIERKKLEQQQQKENPLKLRINLNQLRPYIDPDIIEETQNEGLLTKQSSPKKSILKAKRRLKSEAPSNLLKDTLIDSSTSSKLQEGHALLFPNEAGGGLQYLHSVPESNSVISFGSETDYRTIHAHDLLKVSLEEAEPTCDFSCDMAQSQRSTSSDFDSGSDGPYNKEYAEFLRNRARGVQNEKVKKGPVKKLTKRRNKSSKNKDGEKAKSATVSSFNRESTREIRTEEFEEQILTTTQIEYQSTTGTCQKSNNTSNQQPALLNQKPERKKQMHRRRNHRRVIMYDDSSSDDSDNESPRTCQNEKIEETEKVMNGLKKLRELLVKEAQTTKDKLKKCSKYFLFKTLEIFTCPA